MQDLAHDRARSKERHAPPPAFLARPEEVDAADDALLDALGHRRLRVVLVVEGQVIEDVLAVAEHPLDAVPHDHCGLVRERGVVRANVRDRCREDVAVPVLVLQALAVERGAARGRAAEEAATARVAERPDLVARALQTEHRVEDIEGEHLFAVRRVARARGGERGHRPRLGDAFLEDLAVDRLAVRQKRLRVDRFVALAKGRIDPDLFEERVHAERPCLVGDDRDDALADVLVAQQIPEEPRERHRRRRGRGPRALRELRERRRVRLRERLRANDSLRHEPAERAAALDHVLDLRRIRAGEVVRRVFGELVVGDRELQAVAEDLQLFEAHLLGLVRDVARLHRWPERPALHGLREDRGRRAGVAHRGVVGRVDLAVVVAAAPQRAQLFVGEVLDELAQPRVGAEEMLADIRAVGDGHALRLAVGRLGHPVHEDAVDVAREKLVPLP